MTILTGHLTATDKRNIKAILLAGVKTCKIGKFHYIVEKQANNTLHITKLVKDRGLIPCAGSPLRLSKYISTVKL